MIEIIFFSGVGFILGAQLAGQFEIDYLLLMSLGMIAVIVGYFL